MTQRLQQLYDAIEKQRRALLMSLDGVTDDNLNSHPQGKWSVNQILAHLIAAEKLTVQYLNKKIMAIEQVENSGVTEELKMILLIVSQRLPFKFKAPKIVVEQTSGETNLTKLITAWDISRKDFKDILDRVEEHHLKRKIYRHVRVGMMNVQHAVKFFGEHVTHHTPQIKKLLMHK